MKIIVQKLRYLILVILLVATSQGFAQKSYVLSSGQELKVKGTSTIHDWEMESSAAKGQATITLLNQRIEGLHSLEVELPVNSLKSGKSSMDENAYEALQAKKYPQIKLELTNVEAVTGQTAIIKGKLNIAGKSQPVTIKANYTVSGNAIQFTGSLPVKFTDFNIEPPKAVLGTIKTGNDLQLSFKTTFTSTN